MDRLSLARLVLIASGVLIWGYGYSRDDVRMRMAGIGVLAVALLLRFLRRRGATDRDRGPGADRHGGAT